MADDLRPLQRAHPAGGSLSLGRLLDEAGEEIYLDLKQYWGFDLAEFFNGRVASSPRLIMALIRGLPEESRWTKRLMAQLESGELDEPEIDEEFIEAADREFWNADRQLIAMLHNAIVQNTQLTGHWQKEPPELPLIGPQGWEGVAKRELAKPEKVPQPGDPDFLTYHLSRLGMPAGGGRM